MKLKQTKTAWLFLTPSLLLYGLYVLFPIVYTFYLSTTDWDGMSGFPMPMCMGNSDLSCWQNFYDLLEDEVFWVSFKNNLLWLLFFSLSPIAGLAMALFFHRKSKVASFYKALIFMPMVFSLVVVGMIWSWFLQPEFGLLEELLKWVGVLGPDEHVTMMTSFTWASFGIILAACWPHTAYCMTLYLAGLSNLREDVLEAAALDGLSYFKIVWHMIIPMLRPATIIVVIVTMIGALRTFELIAIMTGGGPANSSNVLANYMYQETFQGFRYGYGAAIAVVLFGISLGLIFAYLKKVEVT